MALTLVFASDADLNVAAQELQRLGLSVTVTNLTTRALVVNDAPTERNLEVLELALPRRALVVQR